MCDTQTNLITERDYGLRYVNFICYKIQCIMCGIINVLLMRHPVTELASHSRATPAAAMPLGLLRRRPIIPVHWQLVYKYIIGGHAVLSGVLLGSTHWMRCLFDP